jgi:methylated-DNA-[protein]-cysteine S-methyltransferase
MANTFRYLESPIGTLTLIETEDGTLNEIFFSGQETPPGIEPAQSAESMAGRQLEEYFAGKRKQFQLNLQPKGTEFQRQVWKELLNVPYGETRSYLQIAEAIGKPTATRAVGAANGANPIPIIIPCHRVIGANGSLTGYGGGLDIKTKLLELEGLLSPSLL